jgi:hypothetical protein
VDVPFNGFEDSRREGSPSSMKTGKTADLIVFFLFFYLFLWRANAYNDLHNFI